MPSLRKLWQVQPDVLQQLPVATSGLQVDLKPVAIPVLGPVQPSSQQHTATASTKHVPAGTGARPQACVIRLAAFALCLQVGNNRLKHYCLASSVHVKVGKPTCQRVVALALFFSEYSCYVLARHLC